MGRLYETHGQFAVYPGHPLTLAIEAMGAFPSAAAALARSSHGWPELLSSQDVSGAGDCCYSACDLLDGIRKGRFTAEQAVAVAADMWRRTVGPGGGNHEDRWEPGQKQADELTPVFLDLCAKWDWTDPAAPVRGKEGKT